MPTQYTSTYTDKFKQVKPSTLSTLQATRWISLEKW